MRALAFGLVLILTACAQPTVIKLSDRSSSSVLQADPYTIHKKLTWGPAANAVAKHNTDLSTYLQAQLHPAPATLNKEVQSYIDGMTISQRTLAEIMQDLEQRRKDADAITDEEAKKQAQKDYQQELNRLARETATRHVLRALYSPHQIHEQMTWFWLNHFNVFQGKHNLRAMVGDYENSALRPHALGTFRNLLGAVTQHPAMLRYLDNDQNAAGRINENFARELMELHTLGVDGGYSQQDVQDLARILTGVGVNQTTNPPKLKKDLQADYRRQGLFEFNPARHDYGSKVFLKQAIKTRGLNELHEALDRLASHPATAQFISKKLAIYWLADEPPAALIQSMAQTFMQSNGNIAKTLETLFTSAEFLDTKFSKFKDPMRFVFSSVRLAYGDKPVLNVNPILQALSRMGQPLYGRATPDGYSLLSSAWSSPAQMTTRFEIAKAIGHGNDRLFKSEDSPARERPAFPQLANGLYFQSIEKTLSPATRSALEQATSQQEWNTLLLASPEMMHR